MSKPAHPFLRRLFWSVLALGALIWGGVGFFGEEKPNPTVLLGNQAGDDLHKVFVKAIESANHSIHLTIYSLSDNKVIETLEKKAKSGVDLTIVHDTSTNKRGFSRLAKHANMIGRKRSGLMHQKILVIDEEDLYIGSANFTTHSLRVHDNLVAHLLSPELAYAIIQNENVARPISIGGQKAEFWRFPKEGVEGLARLITLLDGAKESIRVAMFTWTHPLLTDALIRAHMRGVDVQVVIDRSSGSGVSKKSLLALHEAGVSVGLSGGLGLLHHKFVWIDKRLLVNGSANWTKAAFSRNSDCFLILHELTAAQNKKMGKVWQATWCTRKKADAILPKHEDRTVWTGKNGARYTGLSATEWCGSGLSWGCARPDRLLSQRCCSFPC